MAVPIPIFVPLEQEILAQIKKNIDLWRKMEDRKKSLESGLKNLEIRIDALLVKWSGQPGSSFTRNDLDAMRALAQEIADCLELYSIRHRHKKVLSYRSFAKKMKKLDERLQKLVEKQPPEAPEQVASQPDLDSVEERPDGLATATKKLLELLDTTGMLKVIAIVGFGGSGKTTLANQVFKRTSKDGDQGFPLRAWFERDDYDSVTVLLSKIMQNFWPEETVQRSAWDLKQHIMEKLQGKRYLIVFNDLNDKKHWDCIRTIFDANCGASSRIIVTTRSRAIAYHCRDHGGGYLYEMRAMGDKASKDISGLGNYPYTEKLLEKCGGHPLALRSVKNHFVSQNGLRTEAQCKALCNKLGTYLQNAHEDNTRDFTRLRSVLMDILVGLSDSTAHCCLLYLGIFPNGRTIKKSRVTRRWVAEGYAAENSFKHFIERNIVQPIGIASSNESKLCNTLSILHEFVLHMSMSLDFIMAIQDQKEYQTASTSKEGEKKVQHIFVDGSDITSSGSVDLSCVRSLTVSKEAGLGGAFSQFRKYKLLRVLDMEECCDENLNTHLKDICNLWNLRYLSLGTNISKLPGKFVENLELLESLQLSKEKVSELPVQVIGMPSLKHLIGKIKFMYDKEKDALVQSQKSNLKTIAGAVASAEEKVFLVVMMPNMKNLRKVKIWCTSNGNIDRLDTQLRQAVQWYTKCEKEQRSLTIDFKGLSQDDMEKLQNQGRRRDICYKFFEETPSNKSYLSSLKLNGALSSIPKFLADLSGLTMLCLSLTILARDHLLLLSKVKTLVHLKLIAVRIDSNTLVIPVQGFKELRSLCVKVIGSSAAELKIDIDRSSVRGRGEIVFPLPKMVSLQLLCEETEELPDPSGIQITQFTNLQEIELDPKFKGDARKSWEDAAWNHPNRPNVLPLEFFDDGETAESEQPAAPGVLVHRVADTPDATDARDESADRGNGSQERDNGFRLNPSRFVKKKASKVRNIIKQAWHSAKVPGGKAVP